MSIKPPIKCPPDYTTLVFRLTECKKAGIVKGITTQLAIDLQDMFVPVTNYEQRMMTLKAGETKKIDVSSLGVNWPLQESYQFVADVTNCGDGTTHTYSLYDENLVLIESITFLVDATNPLIATFKLAFALAVQTSTSIKTLMSFNTTAFSGVAGSITATAVSKGIKYRHVFSFDNDGFGGYLPHPYLHPGNLTTPNEKYVDPRIKIMMIYPDFYKANILSNCGCIDASGDMKSNKKYIEYAYSNQYDQIQNPDTPILADTSFISSFGLNWTWEQASTSHIGYHFKVGDLVCSSNSTAPLLRGIITSIQGYEVIVDTIIGDISSGQSLSHVYSPNAIKWRKMGDFYLHTTAQDVLDTDYLYIETLYLKNPHNFDLPIKIMLAS